MIRVPFLDRRRRLFAGLLNQRRCQTLSLLESEELVREDGGYAMARPAEALRLQAGHRVRREGDPHRRGVRERKHDLLCAVDPGLPLFLPAGLAPRARGGRALGARGAHASPYRILGEIAAKTDSPRAASYFDRSLAVLLEIRADRELALAYAGYGWLHKQLGRIAEARDYLTRALEIFERLGTPDEPDKVRRELADLPTE